MRCLHLKNAEEIQTYLVQIWDLTEKQPEKANVQELSEPDCFVIAKEKSENVLTQGLYFQTELYQPALKIFFRRLN